MDASEELIQLLDQARHQLTTAAAAVDPAEEILPGWTIKEILAHISGWDAVIVDSFTQFLAGETPPTPATQGIDVFNDQAVSARRALSLDQTYAEFMGLRHALVRLLRTAPPEMLSRTYTLPWGETGDIAYVARLLAEHEIEHAHDILAHVEQSHPANLSA